MLKRPITAFILVLTVFIFGGIALNRLSVELLPDVERPTMLVRTDYTGAPASEVEYRINEPLEGVLSSVRGVQEIRGLTRQGQSLIFLTFAWGTDMDLVFLNVREKLDQVRSLMPQQAARPQLIYSSASDEPIATLAVSFRDVSNREFSNRLKLKRWAEQVFTRRLEQEEGIAQAVLVGAVEPEIQIRYRPRQIDKYGLSLSEIQQAVRDANIFSSTGELRDGWYRYSLKIESRINSLDDLRNTPVTSLAGNRVLLLGEIADIDMAEADPTSFALLDEEEVLNVLIKKEYGANTIEVFETLRGALADIKTQNPDIEINILQEEATYISNSISNLLQTLLIGGILAFIVLFLFLDDIRSPFTIGISIPVSIFLTFLVMFIFGIQLNIISLSGLTLGIGLLLDNSIVVLENINRYRQQGLDAYESAREGVKEIALPVTASTFTTISVFLPLLFLGGFEGVFFKDLAATLSISLLSSLLVALFILPVFVVQLSKTQKGLSLLQAVNRFLNAVVEKYEQNLGGVLRRPVWVSVGAVILLSAAGWVFMQVDKAALPPSEPAELSYEITLPGNTALRSTEEAARTLTGMIRERLSKNGVLAYGGYTDNTNLQSLAREGLNKFRVFVPVDGFGDAARVRQVFDEIDRAFSNWQMASYGGQNLTGSSSANEAAVAFSVVGTDRGYSRKAGKALEEYLNNGSLDVSLTEKYPQSIQTYNLVFNSDELLLYDLNESEIISYLESLTRGSWVTDWNRQDEQIAIRLVGYREQLPEPVDIQLTVDDRTIPLNRLAKITRATEPEQMERIGQASVLTLNSNLSFTDWWWNSREIRQRVLDFSRQTGIEIKITGSAITLIELLGELGLLLLISVILIYLILAIQYENLKYPLIIILAIPFAWVGSFLALYIAGSSLNALSFMGILILTGIAVNDSILKVDFMRRYFNESGNLNEAISQAGIHRFRPVVMTSMTTVLGLIPMLIPFGDGYVFRQSLAVTLMGGMVTSTLLTLYLIPLVFKWVEGNKRIN